jgi:uncharacterized protein
VSDRLPTRKEALTLLRKTGCSTNVIKHSETVTQLALEIARACQTRGLDVNTQLVEIGAVLHDIGRSETHTVDHGIAGARIAKSLDMPKPIIQIIKRHVGGGITIQEARRLGWPEDVYIPQTIEEKIVCYADKRVEGTHRVPVEETIKKLNGKIPASAISRIRALHEEMIVLTGDCECLR